MIKIIDGDLLDSKTDVIAHQVNCQGVFNSGVAKAIRTKYPAVYYAYRIACKENTRLLGCVQPVLIDEDRICVNLFAQDHYGYDGKKYTDINALRKCFVALKDLCKLDDYSIAMPYKLGCVRGGADWDNEVLPMIEEVFADYDVELWRLDNG